MGQTHLPDRAALASWLEASEARTRHFADPAHHTYLELYLGRADALHALEADASSVATELLKAARCYACHGGLYLRRWPYSRIRQRRTTPLELALISRERDVMTPISAVMGAPTMTLLAGLEGEELRAEVQAITGGALGDVPAGAGAALGALALLYWACLSALVAGDGPGFDAARLQARVVLDMFELSEAGAAARMRAAHEALGALKPLDAPAFLAAWRAHLAAAEDENPHAIDRAALAMGCAADAAGIGLFSEGESASLARHVAYVRALGDPEAGGTQ